MKIEEKNKGVRDTNPAWRYALGLVVLGVLFIVVFFASFYFGRFPVAPPDVIRIILSYFNPSLTEGIDPSAVTSITQIRFPRVVVAAFVGAALSIAGAAFQGMFQNPMASQDLLGASSGAAFGAGLAIFIGFSAWGITALAFVFGLVAVAIAYAISIKSPISKILAMILAGIVISSLFSSGLSYIKLVADTESALPAITYWLMGSLTSIRIGDMQFAVPLIIIASLPLFLLRWRINLLATGEAEARSMGINVNVMRLVVISCATILTATCVSISGMIGWVGLVIPHFCRLIFGYDYRRLIPAAMLMGATFLILVDDIARLATTSEIPIGILTAVVAAPVFIILLMKGGKSSGQNL